METDETDGALQCHITVYMHSGKRGGENREKQL